MFLVVENCLLNVRADSSLLLVGNVFLFFWLDVLCYLKVVSGWIVRLVVFVVVGGCERHFLFLCHSTYLPLPVSLVTAAVPIPSATSSTVSSSSSLILVVVVVTSSSSALCVVVGLLLGLGVLWCWDLHLLFLHRGF